MGGFSIIGGRFFGGGIEGAKAGLDFKYDGKKTI